MSEPKKTKKKPGSKPKASESGNAAVVWAIRGVAVVVLGGLLILAVQDFQARQAAASTSEAWRSALRSKNENSDLTKSEFSKIPVKGSPTSTSEKAGRNDFNAVTLETYTWKGPFRTFSVKVYLGLGNDPPIEQIDGP